MQKYPNFYRNFEILCLRRGEPKSTVIERCGINKSNNIRWANGSDPSIRTIGKLAEYFGVREIGDGTAVTAPDVTLTTFRWLESVIAHCSPLVPSPCSLQLGACS